MRHNLLLSMVAAAFSAATVSSCIKSDTPPTDVKGVFTEFEAEGQKKSTIDTYNRTVVLDLLETADPKKVKISKVALPSGGTCDLKPGSVVDLSSPLKVKITTFADYEWTVSATQTIDRVLKVAGQVGAVYFEEHSHSAFAYVSVGTDITQIAIERIKLGPEGQTTMTPDLNGQTVSFKKSTRGDQTRVREVTVEYRDVRETWSLYVTETETQINKTATFANGVYLSAYGQEGEENGFEYMTASAYDAGSGAEWLPVTDEIHHEGGVFWTVLTKLDSETRYVARAYSGESYSDLMRFETEGTRALPGAGLDDWYMQGSKLWNPWPEGGAWEVDRWWDTGNPGATTLGDSNSVPTEVGEGCPAKPGGRAAKLESKFVGIGTIGRPAGGNIFFGKYGKTTGLNGTCDIGHPWQHKPTRLKGYYRYYPQPIDYVGELQKPDADRILGKMDSLNVTVALWASPDGRNIPYTVNTDPKNFVEFTKKTKGVIAFGAFTSAKQQNEWTEFSIDIEYLEMGELPANTQLYIQATASKQSNMFTAGTGKNNDNHGSLMYIDEMWLEYD